MELFLNAVWAALAVAALARLGRRSTAAALATICALALLFPIISITDDLHAPAAGVEEISKAAVATVSLIVSHAIVLTIVGVAYEKPCALSSFFVWRGLSARAP